MTHSSPGSALDQCPVCKSRLVSLFERQEGLFVVSCENDDCIFTVETVGGSAKEAVQRWNTRPAPAQAAQDQQLRDALREAERVRDEWCAEYVAIRDVQPQAASQLRSALEQIAIACTDNMARSCDHRMALDFVRQVANDALSRPQCQTCGGRREVGGFVSAESGYQTDPCPDCSAHPSQKQE